MLFLDPLPEIKASDFPANPLVESERSGESSDSSGEGRKVCKKKAPCRILEVKLVSEHDADEVKSSTSYTEAEHDDVPADGRFKLFPTQNVKIQYKVEEPDGIDSAVLEVFPKGSGTAIWTQTLDALTEDGEVDYDGGTNPDLDDFPAEVLTEAKSPYKLKMTIRPKDLVGCPVEAAWTYFDVRLDHSFKLVGWTPTTKMGRLGLEFDPRAKELRVIINVFYMLVNGTWINPPATHMASFKTLNEAMWSDKFRLKHDSGDVWKLRFVVNNVGSGHSTDVLALEDHPQQRVDEFWAADGHMCVSLRPGIAGSALIFRLSSKVANLLMFEAGFDREHPVNSSRKVMKNQREFVAKAIQEEIERFGDAKVKLAPRTVKLTHGRADPGFQVGETVAVEASGAAGTVTETTPERQEIKVSTTSAFKNGDTIVGDTSNTSSRLIAAPEDQNPNQGPTFEVAFDDGVTALNGSTATVQAIAQRIAALTNRIDYKLWVKGCRKDSETPGAEAQRATAVKTALNVCGDKVKDDGADVTDADAGRVLVVTAHRSGEEKTGYEDQRYSYCAAVHEFGHSIGLPDEYQDFSKPGLWGSTPERLAETGFLQSRMKELIQAEPGIESWPEPYCEHASLMSSGEDFHKRYYLTVLEALRKTIAPSHSAELNKFKIVDDAGPDRVVRDFADYARLATALKAAAKSVNEGANVPDTVKAALRDDASGGGASVVYVKIQKRADLADATAFAEGDELLYSVGAQVGREMLHCVLHQRVELPKPVLEMVDFRQETANGYELFQRASDDAAARYKVLLKATCSFTGNGTFQCGTGGVSFHTREFSDSPVDAVGGVAYTADQLVAGVTLFAQGVVDNTDMTLTLAATAGQVTTTPKRVRLTLVPMPTPRMEMYSFSVDEGERPEPLAHDDRRSGNSGAFVPARDGNPEPLQRVRVKLTIHKPAVFRDDLILRVPDAHLAIYKRKTDTSGKGKRQTRKSAQGSDIRIVWREYKFGRKNFNDANQFTVWLEGKAPNGQKNEAPVQLCSTGRTNDWPTQVYDEIQATVFSIGEHLTFEIPTTAPMSERLPDPPATGTRPTDNKPPALQTFDPLAQAGDVRGGLNDQPLCTRNFYRNPPLVLVKGSVPDGKKVALVSGLRPAGGGEAPNSLKPTWRFERAKDDHANVKQGSQQCDDVPPTVISRVTANDQPDVTKVEIPTTDHGSFHLLLKVGPSTAAILNVAVVKAEALTTHEAPTVGVVAGHDPVINDRGQLILHTGPERWQPADAANAVCAHLQTRVLLVGGGPNGDRGVEKVFPVWIQNKRTSTLRGTYRDFVADREYRHVGRFVKNKTAGQTIRVGEGGADTYFKSNHADPDAYTVDGAHPMLDTGNRPVGGSQTSLGAKRLTRNVNPGPPQGEWVVAGANDCPGTEFLMGHFEHGLAMLTRAQYTLEFRSHICAFADSLGLNDGGTRPGALLYADLGEVTWQVEADLTFDWEDDMQAHRTVDARREANARWFREADIVTGTAFAAQITTPFAARPARPAEGNLEVRSPTPIWSFCWDTTA